MQGMKEKTSRVRKRPQQRPPGLPSREDILQFIQTTDGPTGKREIAKAFGLKGNEKIALKALLKDMAEEGLIDGKRTAYHRMGGLPKVTVLKVVTIEDGEPIGEPESWEANGDKPRLRLIEKKGQPALKRGDRVLSRCEETAKG
jgi:ribonuclease R